MVVPGTACGCLRISKEIHSDQCSLHRGTSKMDVLPEISSRFPQRREKMGSWAHHTIPFSGYSPNLESSHEGEISGESRTQKRPGGRHHGRRVQWIGMGAPESQVGGSARVLFQLLFLHEACSVSGAGRTAQWVCLVLFCSVSDSTVYNSGCTKETLGVPEGPGLHFLSLLMIAASPF